MKHKLQLLVALFAATAVAAFGQSSASLSGTVTDPTGAAVPNAHVVVHSLGTGADRAVDTDGAGLYAVPALLPGDYSVKVSATGFSNNTVPSLTLNVDSKVTLNLKLAVASAGETVQVEAQAAGQIETEHDNCRTGYRSAAGSAASSERTALPGSHGADAGRCDRADERQFDGHKPRPGRELVYHGGKSRRLGELPDQRYQPERHQPEPDHVPAVDQHDERVQDQQSDLQRGIWAQRWLDCDGGDALGHKPVPWRGVRLLPQ